MFSVLDVVNRTVAMIKFTTYKLFFVVSNNKTVTSDHVEIPDTSENFAAMALFHHLMGRFPGWKHISIQVTDSPTKELLIDATRK